MGRVIKLLAIATVFLVATSMQAQTTPDFTGKWTLVPETSTGTTGSAQSAERGARVAPGTMGTGWGADLTVTQDSTKLTVEYQPYVRYDMQSPMKFVYLLNGSPSTNTINTGRGPQEQISKAVWVGSSLVITTVHTFKNPQNGETNTSETRQTLLLESPASLVVESTRSGVMGGRASTTKTMYKK